MRSCPRIPIAAALVAALLAPAARSGERGADGRFDERRSSHFLLLQDVDIDRRTGRNGSYQFERSVLDVLEEAYDRLDDWLRLRPRRRIQVLIYDPAVFDRDFAGAFRFPAAGFYHGVIRVRGDTQVTPRLESVLHHELVHAALDQEAPSAWIPAWLNEGLAEWFEARARGKRGLSQSDLAVFHAAGRLLPLETLSTRGLGHLGPDAARLAYLQSYGLVDHVARARGERAVRDLLERYLRVGDLDRALERVARTDASGLARSFAAELGLATP